MLKVGAKEVRRTAAPNDHPLFIETLSTIVAEHLQEQNNKPGINPSFLMRCPMCVNPNCRDSKQWYRTLCDNGNH